MVQDIRLHGQVTKTIEYFATVAGPSVSHRFFYETASPHEDIIIRFFCPGSEFIIGKHAITYKGNGGSFCEYMFGINQPIKDMIKKEVVNRLVMNGAIYEPNLDHIYFTDQTEGSETYEEVFLHGSALANYYFFIHDPSQKDIRKQQELFLKVTGRRLKYSKAVAKEQDLEVLREILEGLNMPDAIVFLFKIVNRANKNYYEMYRKIYNESKGINPKGYVALEKLAKTNQISKYQQERINVDVIYKHPDNKRLIDEYKDILVEVSKNPMMNSSDIARLNRLRTLSVRQNIPMEVFLTLDELFLKGKKIEPIDEPKYLSATREILEGLFLKSHNEEIVVSKEDLIMLLRAKLEALEKRDFTFEGLLLEVGKTCDEHSRTKKDTKILEKFGYIITFFDRCDTTYTTLNQIIFMDNIEITEKMLRTIFNNKKIFDGLSPKLFKEIFVDKVLKDRYLTEFGRRKIYGLFHGLKEIEDGNLSLTDVVEQISTINQELMLYAKLRQAIKQRSPQVLDKLNNPKERDALCKDLTAEMVARQVVAKQIPDHVLQKVIRDLFQESAYLHEILPQMIENPDSPIREKFLQESGLDRYYIEEIEKEHIDRAHLSEEVLHRIQKDV